MRLNNQLPCGFSRETVSIPIALSSSEGSFSGIVTGSSSIGAGSVGMVAAVGCVVGAINSCVGCTIGIVGSSVRRDSVVSAKKGFAVSIGCVTGGCATGIAGSSVSKDSAVTGGWSGSVGCATGIVGSSVSRDSGVTCGCSICSSGAGGSSCAKIQCGATFNIAIIINISLRI